ncbi:bifunctional phosphoribosyl-AMP cyclohydrolase/phosphoribosyl-ATP diphosphatase HisIE [Prochlorococcus sp. MIT 1307]|uniref:bifunctional phosphoribosyl-AMP cyclohydrolase/phosphoribosyl-ATP diphosphatase HisIE n=1 Tax=Prochlorococcus sp. MIT 1307 TaxID=3096219 RepID=UPI002A757BA1|nr:bifunctional phosphoribosyl-AMP cyclohydrolase/phosphoribosyl-ATP diphosphatase HisIE [Prochlorococcus sp. MIT 1307]
MQSISPNFIENLHFNERGLIPAIAQDWLDATVLMMAWMNRESITKTIQTEEVHYWSRSRNQIWHKGETSGHTQILKEMRYDCDQDVILLSVDQTGSTACHTGARSCFFEQATNHMEESFTQQQPPSDVCSDLFKVIETRRSRPELGSYTNKLLDGGDNQILKKIGEETAEFVMACKDEDKDEIANEAADLIFHIQVALAKHSVRWRDVLKVLSERKGAPRRVTKNNA